MIKVCQVTSVHNRYDVRIFQKISKSLANNGYNVTLLCIDQKPDEIVDGIKIISVKKAFKNRVDRILSSGKLLLKQALEINADIYHLHDPELLSLGVKLKKNGKKVIFDSHEDYVAAVLEKEWLPKLIRTLVSKIYAKKEKRNLKKYDGVISVTPNIVERLKVINSNTIMITNYPILTSYTAPKPEKINICFAGGISPQWKHENIIKALEKFAGKIRYTLIGDLNSSYGEKLREMDGFKYVDAIGKIPYDKVKEYYEKASAGVALNDYVANVDYHNGSLGNTKLFEVMMAGLPVICTDFVLWKEIVEVNKAGICVNPNEVSEIEMAIMQLLQNPQLIKEYGKNARTIAENKFNWTSQEMVLLDLYREI